MHMYIRILRTMTDYMHLHMYAHTVEINTFICQHISLRQVQGLKPNESYVFAVAAVDAHGQVIEGVGETSVPIVALLPLPTLLLWGHISVTASQVKLPAVVRGAGVKLYTHFVEEGPRRSVWEQNPVDRDMLKLANVQRAPQPLLRVFVQVRARAANACIFIPVLHVCLLWVLCVPPNVCTKELALILLCGCRCSLR